MTPPHQACSVNGQDTNGHHDRSSILVDQGPNCEDALRVFQSITMVDVLDQDPRPAFVLDLEDKSSSVSLQPVFHNQALKNLTGLIEVVAGVLPPDPYGQPAPQTYAVFMQWALDFSASRQPLTFLYHGFTWSNMTINNRWRMVNGTKERQQQRLTGAFANAAWGPKAAPAISPQRLGPGGKRNVNAHHLTNSNQEPSSAKFLHAELKTVSEPPGYDRTLMVSPSDATDHIRFFRSVDWANTPLGPMISWPSQLRHTVNILMATPTPAIVFWGSDLTLIYNEAYPQIVADRIPGLMGNSAPKAFAGAWEMFEPYFSRCAALGRGATFDDMQLFMDRSFGPQEETYVSFSLAPVISDDSEILGWFQHVTETTKRKIGERRMAMIRQVGEKTATAQNLQAFWRELAAGLETEVYDVSFALLYSVYEEPSSLSDNDSISSESKATYSKRLHLEGSVGVPEGHPAAPSFVDTNDLVGITRYFVDTHQATEPLVLRVADGTLTEDLVQGLCSRGFQDPCTSVVIIEIVPTTGYASDRDTVLGFLVLGLNTRRPYDEEYRQFIQVLRRQITTSMAAVLLLEEETRRGRTIAEQAAIDQQIMEEKLSLRTSELEEKNLQLKHFANCVPVGIFVLEYAAGDHQGRYAYRNEKWFDLIGLARDDAPEVPGSSLMLERINKDDLDEVVRKWDELQRNETDTISFTFRVANPDAYQNEEGGNVRWILTYAFSIVDETTGSIRSIFGSFTDITAQKWAENLQKRRVEDALESKRQQETFIDVTSHEMRNPLSAIMISADDIISSLQSIEAFVPETELQLQEVLTNSIDAAKVIADCAQHQKRIVDDILTISKLDSGLFSILPLNVQPIAVLNNLLKMFEGEFASAAITQHLRIEESYSALEVDEVLLDSSRLLQILINIITNAIKFTKFHETSLITISLGASTTQPTVTLQGNEFLPHRQHRDDLTGNLEWGNGEVVYLSFAVQDTGRGLTLDEKKILFRRFSQAPKTHVNYGGSGLGLFISRELVELQGGQIGVASAGKHKGSDFSFYIKTRRVSKVADCAARGRTCSVFSAETQAAYAARSALDHDMDDGLVQSQGTLDSRQQEAQKVLPRHALIVEDNIVNQKVLKKQLVKLGYTVSIANHGIEAISFLSTTRYSAAHQADGTDLSVVLMDSEMPVMDGLSCVRRIREMQDEGALVAHVPVIAITANARIEQVDAALVAGMDDIITKPFRVPELVARVERLLCVIKDREGEGCTVGGLGSKRRAGQIG